MLLGCLGATEDTQPELPMEAAQAASTHPADAERPFSTQEMAWRARLRSPKPKEKACENGVFLGKVKVFPTSHRKKLEEKTQENPLFYPKLPGNEWFSWVFSWSFFSKNHPKVPKKTLSPQRPNISSKDLRSKDLLSEGSYKTF